MDKKKLDFVGIYANTGLCSLMWQSGTRAFCASLACFLLHLYYIHTDNNTNGGGANPKIPSTLYHTIVKKINTSMYWNMYWNIWYLPNTCPYCGSSHRMRPFDLTYEWKFDFVSEKVRELIKMFHMTFFETTHILKFHSLIIY